MSEKPRLCAEDQPIVPPPALYLPNGKVLVRKAGF
jgi:hypothetical protein